jgi:hypothetical protein
MKGIAFGETSFFDTCCEYHKMLALERRSHGAPLGEKPRMVAQNAITEPVSSIA